MSLSDWIIKAGKFYPHIKVIDVEGVKDFIKALKKEADLESHLDDMDSSLPQEIELDKLNEIIDKLVGDKLI